MRSLGGAGICRTSGFALRCCFHVAMGWVVSPLKTSVNSLTPRTSDCGFVWRIGHSRRNWEDEVVLEQGGPQKKGRVDAGTAEEAAGTRRRRPERGGPSRE